MTFDHVGLALRMYAETKFFFVEEIMNISEIFRTLGRFALPLFAFMIVEGVMHTKNIRRYALRLGIMASLISIFFIVLEYSHQFSQYSELLRAGNIFIDLLLLALAIYFLKHPNWKIKLFTLLPIAFSVLSFVVKGIETSRGYDIHWFPCFLTMQYDFLTILLGLAFFASYYAVDAYIKYFVKVDKDIFVESGAYRIIVNLVMALFATIVHIFYYSFCYIWPKGVFWDYELQLYAIFSSAFILFYSGKRGYNAKWFQYGSYLYYPIHIVIIAIIYIISVGGI